LGNIFSKYTVVFRASKYVLLLNITDKIFSFIVMLLFARILSIQNYGEIVTLFTLSLTLVTIFDLGLPIYMQRQLTIEPLNSSGIFSSVFTAGLLVFIIYILAGSVYFYFFLNELPVRVFLLISGLIYISHLVNLCNRALSSREEFKSQFYSFLFPRLIILAAFITGVTVFTFSADTLLIIMLLGFLVNLALVLVNVSKTGINLKIKSFSLGPVLPVIMTSLPLGLAVVFNYLYDKIDILLISKMIDYNAVAIYSAGYGLFKGAAVSFSFLLVPAFTRISSASIDKQKVNSFFREYFKIILIICLTASIAAFLFSDIFIKFLYTERFSGSAGILKILAPAIIAAGLNNLTGTTLNGMGYFKIVMFITLYALLMNVVLNILFIPRYGIQASAVITVITEYFIFFVELYYLRKILKD
jgi:O-antigen/teichoic acid export membrane protein